MFDPEAVDLVWFFVGIILAYFMGREHGNKMGFRDGYDYGLARAKYIRQTTSHRISPTHWKPADPPQPDEPGDWDGDNR